LSFGWSRITGPLMRLLLRSIVSADIVSLMED
jgi:hypothetical protein